MAILELIIGLVMMPILFLLAVAVGLLVLPVLVAMYFYAFYVDLKRMRYQD